LAPARAAVMRLMRRFSAVQEQGLQQRQNHENRNRIHKMWSIHDIQQK